jgi:3-oxoadipate enol-lactonase
MNSLNLGNTTLHYHAQLENPAAQTLVFINSLGTDFRLWDGVVAALKGRFNTVRHDKAGHGLSSTMRPTMTIKDYAADVEHLLQNLKCTNIVLCGISVGGLIAQHLMLNSSLDIRGAVLSNTGLKIGNDDMWNARITSIENQGLDAIADGVMERWFSDGFRSAQPEQLATYRAMMSRTFQPGYIACCEAIRDHAGFDHGNTTRRLPTLCLGGSVDGSTPPVVVKAVAEHVSAKYIEFEGVGHLPCIEQPERFAEIVTAFCHGI